MNMLTILIASLGKLFKFLSSPSRTVNYVKMNPSICLRLSFKIVIDIKDLLAQFEIKHCVTDFDYMSLSRIISSHATNLKIHVMM